MQKRLFQWQDFQCPHGGLGGNCYQYRACFGLLESIPNSVFLEFELLGCTQKGKGQGYFDFSNQWGHRPF